MIDMWAKLRVQLTQHEGRRQFPYLDTAGKITIGVGRNLTDAGISEYLVDRMLDEDIGRAFDDLRRSLPWFGGLDDVRQRVLLDMCFNMGITRLMGFQRMLQAVQARRYDEAAAQMLDSRWATQVGQRATRLAQMMRSGQDAITTPSSQNFTTS
jgi:lysozyme